MKRLLLTISMVLLLGLSVGVVPSFSQEVRPVVINAQSTDCSVAGSCIVLPMPANIGGIGIQVSGTFSATLNIEGNSGLGYQSLACAPLSGGSSVTSVTGTGIWQCSPSGVQTVRVRASTYASGAALVIIQPSYASPSSSTSVSGGNDAAGATGSAVPAKADYQGINIGGTLTGQTGATRGSQQAASVQVVDASGNQITSFGGTSSADEATFTAGSTNNTIAGGFFQTTATNNALTNGQSGAVQMTANRAVFTNNRNAAGTEIFTSTTPGQVTGANGTFPATQSGTWSTRTQDGSGNSISSTGGSMNVNITGGAATGVAQGSTTAGQTGTLVQCAATTSAPTYTTATTNPLNCDTAGNQRVAVTTSALPTGAATSSNQTNGSQMTQVTDGAGHIQPAGDSTTRAINTACNVTNCPPNAAQTAANSESVGQATDQNFRVSVLPGGAGVGVSTFSASATATLAATPTDIAVLPGNGTTAVYVTSVLMTCTQTTAGIQDVFLFKRSTADSGGTSSAMTAVPLDSNNSAAVSAPLIYTANPTTGTLVGAIDRQKIGFLAPGTASANDGYIWVPGMGQTIVLHGTTQQLAINLNGQTVSGAACSVTFSWIEQ